jgi:hypothetical protein
MVTSATCLQVLVSHILRFLLFLVNKSICLSEFTYILIIKIMGVHKIMFKSVNYLFYFLLFG